MKKLGNRHGNITGPESQFTCVTTFTCVTFVTTFTCVTHVTFVTLFNCVTHITFVTLFTCVMSVTLFTCVTFAIISTCVTSVTLLTFWLLLLKLLSMDPLCKVHLTKYWPDPKLTYSKCHKILVLQLQNQN